MDKRTINECLAQTVQLHRDKEAVTDFDVSYTWGELYALTLEMAGMLRQIGIGKNTHVAIWMDNSIRWIVLFFALNEIGAIPVLINVAYKWRELEANLSTCDVEYIFYSPKFKDSDHERTIRKLNRDMIPRFKEAFLVDTASLRVPDREEVLKVCALIEDKTYESNQNDVCSILFTSGTTGRARGAMLTHYNIVNNSKAIVDRLIWNEEDRQCLAVPMFHCFGITVGIMGAVHTGASIHIVRKFKPSLVFETIEKYRCNIFNGVPTMFLAMKNSADRFNYDLTSLRGGLMAGSSILPTEYKEICREFNLKRLNSAYGQTESSPAITVSCDEDGLDKRSGTGGKLLPGVEIKIKNPGQFIGGTQDGEILTRGYHVMKGYYNMPEDTQKAISDDGWLATGDLGHMDEDGYLHITGRIKDIIVRGGENISPAEIEQVVCHLPEVDSVKIVGIPADIIQEEVVACIVPKAGCDFKPEAIKEFVKQQLADYKVPKYVFVFDKFPMNSSGKILSKELSRMCVELIKTQDKRG